MNKHEEILSHLSGPVKFDTPVTVKSSPHNIVAIIHEIDGNKENGVWLRIGDSTWHQLEEKDMNYDMVAGSVLQRLKLMKKYERSN